MTSKQAEDISAEWFNEHIGSFESDGYAKIHERDLMDLDDRFQKALTEAHAAGGREVITGETSDGYHTFNELYEHRVLLFINLCLAMPRRAVIGPTDGDWFVMFLELPTGQISYHMHVKYLPLVASHISADLTHKFDGHTSKDTIERLTGAASRPSSEYERGRRDVIAEVIPTLDFYESEANWEREPHEHKLKNAGFYFTHKHSQIDIDAGSRARALKDKLQTPEQRAEIDAKKWGE